MRAVVLYIAMSIDGYIADRNGGVGWLAGQDPSNNDPGSYLAFIETVDTVVMGYKTYHQITTELTPESWPYAGKCTYVLTHQPQTSTHEIVLTAQSPIDLIAALKAQNGKDIWICGGADIVNQLVAQNLIDRYHITVIPTLLGGGIRLFESHPNPIALQLVSTQSSNGMVDLVYQRRR